MDALRVANHTFKQREKPGEPDRLLELLELLRIWVLVIEELLSQLLGGLSALDPLQLGFLPLLPQLPLFLQLLGGDATMHL